MARKKANKFIGVFQIFFSSIKTYFLYLDQCAKHLSFPIFGQLISLILIFTATYFFVKNVEDIKSDYWIDILVKLSVALTKIILGRIRTRFWL